MVSQADGLSYLPPAARLPLAGVKLAGRLLQTLNDEVGEGARGQQRYGATFLPQHQHQLTASGVRLTSVLPYIRKEVWQPGNKYKESRGRYTPGNVHLLLCLRYGTLVVVLVVVLVVIGTAA